MEYIERDKFIADKKWLYCTNCEKRKGKKHGKMVTIYEIGEAPCKSCGIHDMLEEVEMYPAADVCHVEHGVWHKIKYRSICRDCSFRGFASWKYCPNCGRQMTTEGDNG